jgi:uncharacterized membrane protein YeaQ/YmgE (transglycosylase-associated protein family)
MVGALILGLVAGFLARAILPGKQDMNILFTILLGLVGALVGYGIFRLIGIGDSDIFDLGGLVGAVIGSVIVLYLYERFIVSRRETPRPTSGV